MRGKRITLFFIMIAVGLGLGLLYGWVINPVEYEDTSLDMLRDDYKADYVLMVAEVYGTDQDLEQASRRLAAISSLPAARVVADAVLTAREMNYSADDLAILDQLARAFQNSSPTPTTGDQP